MLLAQHASSEETDLGEFTEFHDSSESPIPTLNAQGGE